MVGPHQDTDKTTRRLLHRLVRQQLRERLSPLLILRGKTRHLSGAQQRNQHRLGEIERQLNDYANHLPKISFAAEMTIDQAWNHHPDAPSVFIRYHLKACNSCAVRFDETLDEAAMAYGLNLSAMLKELNSLLGGP